MHFNASLLTALSAQPPPIQPPAILPWESIMALEPCFAEEDPLTRTTVAKAKDCPAAVISAIFEKSSGYMTGVL